MTPRQAARLRQAIAIVKAKQARESAASFIPHKPTPKQAEFLALDCLEAFYGGAVGGGKSDALLMGAAQHVHVPGYSALVLRRTHTDLALPGAIMDRSHAWWHGLAHWNGTDKRWTFPSGACVTFGYIDNERDRYRYASAEFQYIAFDELTQFPEGWYRFLLSRLRRPRGLDVPLRARAAGNPGGIGHDWVRKRFIESTDPQRRFVAATLADNPHLDADEYRKALAQLDSVTRRQLEEGIWVRDAGGLVYQYDEQRNAGRVPELTHHILGLDFGFTDENGIVVLGWREHDPTIYSPEAYRFRGHPSQVAEEVQRLEAKYHFTRIVGDIGGLGKGYAEEARARFTLPIEPAEKNNKRGYIALLNGDLERGRIKVDPERCAELVGEWQELPWSEDHAKEASGFNNHCADAMLYAWRAAHAYLETPKAPPPTDAERIAREERQLLERAEEQLRREQDEAWWA